MRTTQNERKGMSSQVLGDDEWLQEGSGLNVENGCTHLVWFGCAEGWSWEGRRMEVDTQHTAAHCGSGLEYFLPCFS